MMDDLYSVITDRSALSQGYILRNGFVFVRGDKPAVYDTLLIRFPANAIGPSGRYGFSERTIEDHIELINRYQLENAKIICDDLTFILKCPSLSRISVYPSHDTGNGFDYSPLYSMPGLKKLCCITTYGLQNQYKCTVDYSQIDSVVDIAVSGDGHIRYESLSRLESLWISGNRKYRDFSNLSQSSQLKHITMVQCGIQALRGIDDYHLLESLTLYNNRSLKDISALCNVSKTLRTLAIENCPKITDFSVLDQLRKLEHLHLYGNNTLPDLNFLYKMEKLQTFTFTMDIIDGNLIPCLSVPYVSCKNRRHFNLKDSELPKG